MTVEEHIENFMQTALQDVCESCGVDTSFRFIGTQEWPERVALAMGFDSVVTLWRCTSCDTTRTISISELIK